MAGKDKSYLGGYFKGQLLLAMPGMGDPRFHKAVIYMCVHDDKGAMGLVINHTVPGIRFEDLLKQLDIKSEVILPAELLAQPVMSGGPVETARGFLLHSKDFRQADTIEIDDHFSVTGTVDALKAVAGGEGPKNMVFTLGYAGWGAGQLDSELQQNAWLTAQATPELIFGSKPEEMWDRVIASLGIDPALLSGDAGRA